MDKNRLKCGLIASAPYFAGALIQVPWIYADCGWINAAILAVNSVSGCVRYQTAVKKYDKRMEFLNSPLYQEYLGLYNEFVKDISSLFKDLNIDTGIQSIIAYKYCLENGLFSASGTDEYTVYKDDKDMLIKACGGRVTTGKHCCRHNASLYSDIVNNMGGLSPKITCYSDKKSNKSIFVAPTHLVSGLIHKDKRIVVDPTSSLHEFCDMGICYFRGEKALFRDVVSSDDGFKYTIVNGGYDNGSVHNNIYDKFMQYPAITTFDEILDDFLEAIFMVGDKGLDFYEFSKEEKPKILQLSKLSEQVAPHGDAILKKD